MKPFFSLTNQLLIAMPNMHDYYFDKSVILVCEHSDKGAMGLIINRKVNLKLSQILDELKFQPTSDFNESPVILGGPVDSQSGLVLHAPEGKWDSSFKLSEEAELTSSLDIIKALSLGEAPINSRLVMGYSGWSAGQLEQELVENIWLTAPASKELIFDIPLVDIWRESALSIGVDTNKISLQIGHA